MKWFDNWFAKKCKQALGLADEETIRADENSAYMPLSSTKSRRLNSVSRDIELPDGGLNIQVKSAIGGKIIVFRNYDERNDRNLYTTYLINDSENFEQSLGKIITLESMKL
jgi:hypothetical protein